MAAKGKTLLLLVAIAIIASAPAYASIPRNGASQPPPIDRYAVDDRQSACNLQEPDLLMPALERSMPVASVCALMRERATTPQLDVLSVYERPETRHVFGPVKKKLTSGVFATRPES